jgi:Signal peptidase, peptidase S26
VVHRRVRRLLWVLAVCVLGVLGLRAFVCDLYHVTSSSMAPAIYPGEVVLVAYDRSAPRRFESVVVEKDDQYVVKRAAAFGGEDLLIDSAGDLRIDGEYLPPDAARQRVLVFDQDRQVLGEHFSRGSSQGDPWSEGPDGVLELDARDVLPGREAGLLRYHTKLSDHYLGPDGELVEGHNSVHDAAVEFEFLPHEFGGTLRVGLVEQGDCFWLVVGLTETGATAALLRDDGSQLTVLVEQPVSLDLERWTRVVFSNIDNHLSAALGDGPALEADYLQNTLHPADNLAQGLSPGERVKLGGEGCRIGLRDLRLWRDLHYTSRGEYGVGRRLTLQPGQVFLLGDNSAASYDSREFGAVSRDQVVGRPVMVVWPPSAIRRLR